MPFCNRCNRSFKNNNALSQHIADSDKHHVCDDCNRDFAAYGALVQHYKNSPRHAYCNACDELFDDFDDLDDHYEEDHYWCSDCREVRLSISSSRTFRAGCQQRPLLSSLPKFFCSAESLHNHNSDEHADRYCTPCKILYQNHNNLRHHQRSQVHAGRNIHCPMKRCARSFVSRAGLVAHLESGACKSGMTRKMIDDIVHRLDTQGIITDPARMLTNGGSKKKKEVTTWATERAWNGSAYECFLCSRTFRSLDALNQHLGSPAHAQKKYHCPREWKGCGTEFKTLSGICQHVESESCGVWRFKKKMDKIIDSWGSGRMLK